MKRIIVVLVCVPSPGGANEGVFPQNQVREWSFDLRSVANGLNGFDHELAKHFYNVHYAIGPDADTSEYDSFALDEDYLALEVSGGREGVIASLKVVLANGERCVDPAIWDNGLRSYLEQLLDHMTA